MHGHLCNYLRSVIMYDIWLCTVNWSLSQNKPIRSQDISGGNAGAQKMFSMMLQIKHYKSIATFLEHLNTRNHAVSLRFAIYGSTFTRDVLSHFRFHFWFSFGSIWFPLYFARKMEVKGNQNSLVTNIICSTEKRQSYKCGMTWGRVNE